MPLRPVNREPAWLLQPTVDDLLPEDHSVRFVVAFVDGLDHDVWAGMKVALSRRYLNIVVSGAPVNARPQ